MSFMIRSEDYSVFLQVNMDEIQNSAICNEILIDQKVTYTLVHLDWKLFVIKNVHARVNVQTGEQFFSPKNC